MKRAVDIVVFFVLGVFWGLMLCLSKETIGLSDYLMLSAMAVAWPTLRMTWELW